MPSPPKRSLLEVATLITCSVLDGYALARVVPVAQRLAERLHHAEEPGAALPRRVLSDALWACEDFIRVAEPDEPGSDWWSRLHTPRVWVSNPTLPKVVLEVVWRKLTAAHDPLTRWLSDLATPPPMTYGREFEAVAARRAISLLAQVDFDHVYRTVLTKWASSDDRRLNVAAVEVLAQAIENDHAVPAVRLMLRQWSRPGAKPMRRRTAILAYAGALGMHCSTSDVLRAVRLVGNEDPDRLAVRALARLVVDRRGDRVLADLAARLGRGDSTALGQFLALASGGEGDLPDLRPALLSAGGESAEHEASLAYLWTLALREPSTSPTAWHHLRRWIALTAHRPELLESLGVLVRRLLAEAYVAPRLRFVLRLWRSRCSPPERSALTFLSRAAPMETEGGR